MIKIYEVDKYKNTLLCHDAEEDGEWVFIDTGRTFKERRLLKSCHLYPEAAILHYWSVCEKKLKWAIRDYRNICVLATTHGIELPKSKI